MKNAWYTFCRELCKFGCHLFLRVRPYGLENVPRKGPVVLLSNHQSFFDPVFCGMYLTRPLHFLARDSLFRNPIFGRLIASVNTIPVRRGEADLSAIKRAIAVLKDDGGLVLFPEATRTADGKIAHFKPGIGLISRRSGASVVPVLVEGAFECWPRHKKMFSPGARIEVHYGKALSPQQLKNMSDEELAETLTCTLRRMQKDCRIQLGKEPYQYNADE